MYYAEEGGTAITCLEWGQDLSLPTSRHAFLILSQWIAEIDPIVSGDWRMAFRSKSNQTRWLSIVLVSASFLR
jgi:hypothetical protein